MNARTNDGGARNPARLRAAIQLHAKLKTKERQTRRTRMSERKSIATRAGDRTNVARKSVWIVILVLPIILAIVLLMAGSPNVTANAQPSPKTAEVKIDNFSFGPGTVTVAVGSTLTWTNHDDIPHTVVSTDKVFKSKVLDTDEKYSYTFAKAGTYPYTCSIHAKMTGTVIVQ
jgi:plastocyanin